MTATSTRQVLAAAATSPRRLVAAAAVGAVLTLTACSGGEGPAANPALSSAVTVESGSPSTAEALTVLTPAATAPPTAPAPTSAAPVAVDGPALLSQALDSLSATYHFDTNVTVDGAEVLVAAGDRVGDGTRLSVWASGGSVAYVITPVASWVFPEGGEWEALDTAPGTTDPIGALRTPTAVTALSSDGTNTTLSVTVPATSLGIPGSGDASLTVVVNAGTLTEITYATTVDGRAAAVRSVLGPVVDATAVVAPI